MLITTSREQWTPFHRYSNGLISISRSEIFLLLIIAANCKPSLVASKRRPCSGVLRLNRQCNNKVQARYPIISSINKLEHTFPGVAFKRLSHECYVNFQAMILEFHPFRVYKIWLHLYNSFSIILSSLRDFRKVLFSRSNPKG